MRRISTTMQLANCIRNRRLRLGLTQREVADASGVSVRSVRSLELGESAGIRLDKLRAVAGALGLSMYLGEPGEAGDAPITRVTDLLDGLA